MTLRAGALACRDCSESPPLNSVGENLGQSQGRSKVPKTTTGSLRSNDRSRRGI